MNLRSAGSPVVVSGWGGLDRLVAPGGVEGVCPQEFAGGGVHDADVEVGNEHDDAGSGVGSPDADAVEAPGVSEGDFACLVDAVVADTVVGVGAAVEGAGFRPGRVGGGRCCLVGQGAVRPGVVVGAGERVEEGLQLGDRGGLIALRGEPLFQGLLEAFDFPAGGRVVGPGVLLDDTEGAQFVLEGVAAAFAARQPGGEHHAVVGQGGCGWAVAGDGGAKGVAHDRAGHARVGSDRQGVAGVVVQPRQDFDIGAETAVGASEGGSG